MTPDVSQAPIWHKSTYSSGKHENCVEVAELSTGAMVRDTQNRDHGALTFAADEWTAFLDAAQRGDL